MTHAKRASIVGAAFVAVAGLASCGEATTGVSDDLIATTVSTTNEAGTEEVSDQRAALDEAEELFDATVGSTYTVTFDFVGQISAEAGSVVVEVANGEAADVSYPEPILASVLPDIPLLTVDDMFERARATMAEGGVVEVTFDESYGHPTVLSFDPIPDAIDDEYSVIVRSVEPGDDTIDSGDGY